MDTNSSSVQHVHSEPPNISSRLRHFRCPPSKMTLIGKASRYAGAGGRAIQTVYWRAKPATATSEPKIIKTRKTFTCGTSDNKPEIPMSIQRSNPTL
ncbi:hypothetical protein GE061_007235 [Apolygus lucorum]|uniref:Uncharacterized protein n=1 Tax=Apolygus lucorum TaxID=248454 RepID=A0A8S9WQL0_APOLU|nr:hypothetical protein GE061_007235 [Apolygus lucorum]